MQIKTLPEWIKLQGFSETSLKRFWDKVKKMGPAECWQWTGGKDWDGYGSFFRGTKFKKGKNRTGGFRAHRFSWMIHRGPIPEGMEVLHKCDNPGCVNPNHLRPGTHTDNMRDCANKKRFFAQKHPEKMMRGSEQKCETG